MWILTLGLQRPKESHHLLKVAFTSLVSNSSWIHINNRNFPQDALVDRRYQIISVTKLSWRVQAFPVRALKLPWSGNHSVLSKLGWLSPFRYRPVGWPAPSYQKGPRNVCWGFVVIAWYTERKTIDSQSEDLSWWGSFGVWQNFFLSDPIFVVF